MCDGPPRPAQQQGRRARVWWGRSAASRRACARAWRRAEVACCPAACLSAHLSVPVAHPLQVNIMVRKVRNKAAGTIGDAVLEYERVNGR